MLSAVPPRRPGSGQLTRPTGDGALSSATRRTTDFDCSTASRSTRSFISSPEWPLVHRKETSPRSLTAVISGSHRSRLTTGFLALVTQPRASQPFHQPSRKQFTT